MEKQTRLAVEEVSPKSSKKQAMVTSASTQAHSVHSTKGKPKVVRLFLQTARKIFPMSSSLQQKAGNK